MDPPQKWNEDFQLMVLLISHTHTTASIIFWVVQNFTSPNTATFFFKFPTHSLYLLPSYHPSYTSYGVTQAALLSMIHDSHVLVMLFSLGVVVGGRTIPNCTSVLQVAVLIVVIGDQYLNKLKKMDVYTNNYIFIVKQV